MNQQSIQAAYFAIYADMNAVVRIGNPYSGKAQECVLAMKPKLPVLGEPTVVIQPFNH